MGASQCSQRVRPSVSPKPLGQKETPADISKTVSVSVWAIIVDVVINTPDFVDASP